MQGWYVCHPPSARNAGLPSIANRFGASADGALPPEFEEEAALFVLPVADTLGFSAMLKTAGKPLDGCDCCCDDFTPKKYLALDTTRHASKGREAAEFFRPPRANGRLPPSSLHVLPHNVVLLCDLFIHSGPHLG